MGCPSEVVIEKNITFSIRTHDPDTGALTAVGAVPTYRIYEDGTEVAILSGNLDDGSGTNNAFDQGNLTAAYQKTVACTAANGFEIHKTYTVYLDATVDSDAGGISHGFRVVTAVWDEILSGATYNIPSSAGRRLRTLQDFGVYDLASVWVDETAGQSTGTTDFEDATVTNRADDFDNAQTVAASIDLDRIHVQNDNTITLSATLNGYDVWGVDWTLALGGQDVGDTAFTGATVSGIGTGTTPHFHGCTIGTATLPPAHIHGSSLTATITCGSAGNFQFLDCQSGVAGSGAPTVDLGSGVGATTMEFRRWSGGLTLTNIEAGDVISVDALTGGTLTLTMTGGMVEARGSGMKALVVNGSGGTVNVSGHYGLITDNSAGAVTITQTWATNRSIVNAEVVDALNVDTYAEPGQGVPASTLSLVAKINYLFKHWRNLKKLTASQYSLYDDGGTVVDQKATVSDDNTTAIKQEIESGP